MEDFTPYKNRVEHDFINKFSVEIAKIYLALSELKKLVDGYIQVTKNRRKEDGQS